MMTPSTRLHGLADTPRGQTGVDFIVGIGVFLLTISFVVLFIPGLLAPFNGLTTTNPMVADRVADDLVYQELAADDAVGRLNQTKTQAFFADEPGNQVHVPDGMHVNVTLRAGDTTHATGDPVPTSGASVATSTRVVTYNGTDGTLVVRAW